MAKSPCFRPLTRSCLAIRGSTGRVSPDPETWGPEMSGSPGQISRDLDARHSGPPSPGQVQSGPATAIGAQWEESRAEDCMDQLQPQLKSHMWSPSQLHLQLPAQHWDHSQSPWQPLHLLQCWGTRWLHSGPCHLLSSALGQLLAPPTVSFTYAASCFGIYNCPYFLDLYK
ncbi:uncharacterized protein LOC110351099 isoform X5 [Heterocephalus glaber]|uniref:Uncharacterized protein LOC110351099 isoform X5 n=1 Tax=Heterocephalus glaber TaxID=10181 RepID=A0AAX6THE6_HETGA|nr:uncharacterized protein LOC110351099 isoform X5 [Heterocephalus glaber]